MNQCSIAEHYNRWMAEAFEGLTRFRRIVDDVIIYDKDVESHRDHVQQFLQRCQERQISINKYKFAGFQVSSEGYLTVDEDLMVYGCRLLVPRQMRRKILHQLHKAHQRMVHTKQRARLTIYWPGLDNDIDKVVSRCTQCQIHLPSHPKEPLISKPRPARPFQGIAADFCYHAGRSYLVFVDCLQTGQMLFPWANVPLLQISLQQRGNCSAVWLCQMCSDQTVDPSLPPINFSIFLHSGDFDINYPPPTTHRATGRQRPL